MRIISGIFGSRNLIPPSNFAARPTTDFAKQGLFNILNNQIDISSLQILDLFAGSGNISFEFLSRGSKQVVAVDNNQHSINFIRKTAVEWNIPSADFKILKADAFIFVQRQPLFFDLIFADPPYELNGVEKLPDLIFANLSVKNEFLLIIEHSQNISFEKHPYFSQERKYGTVHFSFFEKNKNFLP